MTDPIEGAETGPETPTAGEGHHSQRDENANKTLVKLPGMTNVLKSQNGAFPDITNKGTYCTDDEVRAAKTAAKAIRLKLKTSRGQR